MQYSYTTNIDDLISLQIFQLYSVQSRKTEKDKKNVILNVLLNINPLSAKPLSERSVFRLLKF